MIAAQIARLVFLRQLQGSSDLTYHAVGYSIATQCQTSLAVVVACIPVLKPFMDRATSGMMAISLEQRAGTYDISNGYAMHSLSKQQRAQHNNADMRSGAGVAEPSKHSFRPGRSDHHAVVSSSNPRITGDVQHDDWMDGGASDKFMIQKTVDWDVQYGDDQRQSADDPNETPHPDMVHTHTVV